MTKQIRLSDRKPIEDMNIARALAKYPELSVLKDSRKIIKEAKIKGNRKPYLYSAKDFSANNGYEVIHGDFIDVCKEIPEETVDCVFTDPPYGKDYLHLWSELSKVAARVLKPSGFCICYSGTLYLPEVYKRLSENLDYYWQFTLFFNGGVIQDIYPVGVRSFFRPVPIFVKPPKKILHKGFPADVINRQYQKSARDIHQWGQPISGIVELLSIFTNEGDLILDPMCGSGTTLLACKRTNRRCIGIDIDVEQVAVSKGRLSIPFLKQGRIK